MNATEIIFDTETLEEADESVSMIRGIMNDPPSLSWNTFMYEEREYTTILRATYEGSPVSSDFIMDSCMFATDMSVETRKA